MPLLSPRLNNGLFYLDQNTANACDDVLSEDYASASPFPHIVIDEFISSDFLEQVLQNFPDRSQSSVRRKSENQSLKHGYRPDDLGINPCRYHLAMFGTRPMLEFLEKLTGLAGLIPDPWFLGGGFHETEPGGRLAIHADFNVHPHLNLVRRLNLILFLNQDWPPEYGGHLELWDSTMTSCEHTIEPVFNRCVIFGTDKQSFHGHPTPLDCPPNRSRRSIALYYYTTPGYIPRTDRFNTETDWRRAGNQD